MFGKQWIIYTAYAVIAASAMVTHESIFDQLKETIILVDKARNIVFVNKSGEELFQRSANEIIGKNLGHFIHKKSSLFKLIPKTLSEGRSFRGYSETWKIGRDLNVDFNLVPYFRESEIAGALLSIVRNEHVREHSDDDSQQYLLAAIAHEVKNPLGGIKGAAQLLRKMTENNASAEFAELIIKETDRLDGIVQGYLRVCRKPARNRVNIHEVIEKCLTILKVPLQESAIEVHRLYDPSLPEVRGDEGQLLQAFLNVIKNAQESTGRGGVIEISSRPSSELLGEVGKSRRMAMVGIRDSGEGIPEKDLPKIFTPFYTKKGGGTGMGLAITKQVIRDHGGIIKVKSRKKEGTTFMLYLPFGNDE